MQSRSWAVVAIAVVLVGCGAGEEGRHEPDPVDAGLAVDNGASGPGGDSQARRDSAGWPDSREAADVAAPPPKCGNNKVEGKEECDGADLQKKSCATLGFAGGQLVCDKQCQLSTADCHRCGNKTIDLGEECDGSALGGKSCVSQGFDKGTLACSSLCKLNTSGCTFAGCGDGVLDPKEACDGSNLGGKTCAALGFAGGLLGCNLNCTLDSAGCYKCGDGKKNGSEACDGADLGGKTCSSSGFTSGSLACTAGCQLDTSGCEKCGDGKLGATEECDGSQLGGMTCASLGYQQGTLTCAGCKLSSAGCQLLPTWSALNWSATALNSAWVAPDGRLWAVGPVIVTREGIWWRRVSSAGGTLNAVHGSSATTIWAVGKGIARYDGVTWRKEILPDAIDDIADESRGVYVAGNQVWVAGHQYCYTYSTSYSCNGYILHYDGSAWSIQKSKLSELLYAIWGSSATDIWAAGDGALYHYGRENLRSVAGAAERGGPSGAGRAPLERGDSGAAPIRNDVGAAPRWEGERLDYDWAMAGLVGRGRAA